MVFPIFKIILRFRWSKRQDICCTYRIYVVRTSRAIVHTVGSMYVRRYYVYRTYVYVYSISTPAALTVGVQPVLRDLVLDGNKAAAIALAGGLRIGPSSESHF